MKKAKKKFKVYRRPKAVKGVPRAARKIKGKHVAYGGREKAFDTPDALWQEFLNYKEWAESNPHTAVTNRLVRGKMKKTEEKILGRPLTIVAFCVWCGVTESYFRVFRATKEASENELDKSYLTIIGKIKDACTQEKFEGAAVGKYNANLISRDLGLADNVNINDDRKSTGDLFPTDEEFKKAKDKTKKK